MFISLITYPLFTGNPLRGTLANSEDMDKMQHNAASDKGLHFLLRSVRIKTIFRDRNT